MLKYSLINKNNRFLTMVCSFFEWRFFYVISIFLLFLGFLSWSSVSEISRVVRVEGKIVPAGRSQKIQHLEGGILSSIYVQEGDFVHKGDKLLAVDNTQAGANLSETNVKIFAQEARAFRLKAEAEGQRDFLLSETQKKSEEYRAESDLFFARQNKLQDELDIEESILKQREAELSELKSKRGQLSIELKTANERYQVMEEMAKSGAASKLEIIDAKSRKQNIQTEIGAIEGAIPKTVAGISETQNRLKQITTKFQVEAQTEYVAVIAEIERLRQVATAANDRLSRTEITSPADGIINTIHITTIGGVIKSGDVLVELTPVNEKIVIEAKSSPSDRGFIHPGLKAKVKLTSYDSSEYGFLDGVVSKVGSDSIQDARGQSYYQVNVLVDQVSPLLREKEIIPGMVVSVDVVTGERTILKYLLSPVSKFSSQFLKDPR